MASSRRMATPLITTFTTTYTTTFTMTLTTLCYLTSLFTLCAATGNRELEICENERLNITCRGHEPQRILINTATYGRMSIGRCVQLDYGHLGCRRDVLSVLDKRCSGLKSCQLRVPHHSLGNKAKHATGCPGDLKPYLHVTFTCVRVNEIDLDNRKCDSVISMTLQSDKGHIPSMQSNCRMSAVNYHIKTLPGKRLRFELFDFSSSHQKDVYARIFESGNNFTILQRSSSYTLDREKRNRSSLVYESRHSKVNLLIPPRSIQQSRFIIRYSAIGCTNPIAPKNTKLKFISVDQAEVSCGGSKQGTQDKHFRLHCVNDKWVGKSINCTYGIIEYREQRNDIIKMDFTKGLSVMLMLAIAFLISSIMLIAGLYYFKRRSLCSRSGSGGETETKLYHEMSYASAASCAADRALYGDRLLTSAAAMAGGECGAPGMGGPGGGTIGATLAPCGCATYVTRRDLNSTLPPSTAIQTNGPHTGEPQRCIVPAYFLLRDASDTRNMDNDIPPPPPHRNSPEPHALENSLSNNDDIEYKLCDTTPSH